MERGTFDLIWALSVFTHLTGNSLPWLCELRTLLKPNGLLIATYMGRWNGIWFTGEYWNEDLVGMNVLRPDQGWEDGGPVVLMSDWWVRAHWGRGFEFLNVLPQMHDQTWVLLGKRDLEITLEEIARPADDPREYLALKHNVHQVEADRERTVAEIRSEHEATLSRLRREYESSLSWRLTRPLRIGKRMLQAFR